MASCIFKSVLASVKPAAITVSGPHPDKLQHFKDDGAEITADNVAAANKGDVIFLGVKPQVLTSVLEELKQGGIDFAGRLVISMAAGFKLSSIERILGTGRLVRIMPNTPAKIGLGVIAVSYGKGVTAEDKALTGRLLAGMGHCIEGSEEQLNTIGAVCGCGPAFVFRFMEALVAESVRHGISEADARAMVEDLVSGSVSLVKQSPDSSLASLREAVTSKGGTTYAGLCAMTEGRFEEMMQKTVQASLDRTYEFERMF